MGYYILEDLGIVLEKSDVQMLEVYATVLEKVLEKIEQKGEQ